MGRGIGHLKRRRLAIHNSYIFLFSVPEYTGDSGVRIQEAEQLAEQQVQDRSPIVDEPDLSPGTRTTSLLQIQSVH